MDSKTKALWIGTPISLIILSINTTNFYLVWKNQFINVLYYVSITMSAIIPIIGVLIIQYILRVLLIQFRHKEDDNTTRESIIVLSLIIGEVLVIFHTASASYILINIDQYRDIDIDSINLPFWMFVSNTLLLGIIIFFLSVFSIIGLYALSTLNVKKEQVESDSESTLGSLNGEDSI